MQRQASEKYGITTNECVVLTTEQVKSQRKARQDSKAVSAGNKGQAEDEPVFGPKMRRRMGPVIVIQAKIEPSRPIIDWHCEFPNA